MPKSKKKYSKTEIKLTVAATILAVNLNNLIKEFLTLAAKNDVIPDPNIETSVHHSISRLSSIFDKHNELSYISQDVISHMYQLKKNHAKLDA